MCVCVCVVGGVTRQGPDRQLEATAAAPPAEAERLGPRARGATAPTTALLLHLFGFPLDDAVYVHVVPWSEFLIVPSYPHHPQGLIERLAFYCLTTSASTAPCTSRRMFCPTHCASYRAPCQPLLRAFPGWIRSPPASSGASHRCREGASGGSEGAVYEPRAEAPSAL